MTDTASDKVTRDDLLRMAVDVVAAYLSNNQVSTTQIPEIINSVFNSLTSLEVETVEVMTELPKPATTIRKSVTPEYLVCLEDGKKLKMLKRHLRTNYSMTPEDYRAKWNLPPDYPMVAPNYARQRSEFAKKIGLGKKDG
ncbi:MucR family transcriptional regulator [Defluviicoccus vanus]|uniref:MucR family transcriptional regulator n=1 Tax=Defluviicoccus vanus TaxID=111831 RepID=A0A7H1MX98_9PROT|nr:MucR family transcriptional regulator [Defluviicoccus vanus]QNT68084.1 MucR family transcriptional regulator [Defluviicoccus vanus]